MYMKILLYLSLRIKNHILTVEEQKFDLIMNRSENVH